MLLFTQSAGNGRDAVQFFEIPPGGHMEVSANDFDSELSIFKFYTRFGESMEVVASVRKLDRNFGSPIFQPREVE